MHIPTLARWMASAVFALVAGCAQQPGQPQPPAETDAGIVSVTYADPSRFTDALAHARPETNVQRREWITLLCEHLAERAAPLMAPGERLEVQILDVRRAGYFDAKPQAGSTPVRIVSEGSPPRIELEFKRVGSDGEIVQIGRRTLDQAGFMQHAQRYPGDSLRYERALLDGWVAQEFGTR